MRRMNSRGPTIMAMAMLVAGLAASMASAQSKKKGEAAPAAAAGAAQPAQPAAGAGEAPDAWAVNCSNQAAGKFACEMTQAIVDERSRAQIVLISVKGVTGGTAGASAMLFRVTHGIFLPGGLAVTIDGGQPVTIQFQKSDQVGIYAALPLDEKITESLRKGKDLKISLQLNQGQPVEISARLTGFAGALDKVRALERS